MNAIKKQLKAFWTYFRLCKYGVNMSGGEVFKSYIPTLVCIIASLLLAYVQFFVTKVDSGISFSFSAVYLAFACGAAFGMGIATRQRPSMLSTAPFSPVQRVVFSFFAALLRAVVMFVFFTVLFALALFLAGCLVSLAIGEFVFTVEGGITDGLVQISPYASAFTFLFGVILFFAYFAICNIDRAKMRNIAAVSFAVGTLILSTVFVNVCEAGTFTADLTAGFASLNYPWVVILAESVIAIAAFVASVFVTIKRFKSSKI